MKPSMPAKIVALRPANPSFQFHLSTASILMLVASLVIPLLIHAWDGHGFGIVLLVCVNFLLLVAMIAEFLVQNTCRRWNDPPREKLQ